MRGRVVTLTAGMGAGHDQVALELSRRLAERGVEAEVMDLWDLLPLGIGRLITRFYKAVVRHAPWLYELIYMVWLRPSGEAARRASPIIRLAGRRLRRWMAVNQPTAAVSTFHLCSQVLGDLRRQGAMPIPTASIVVDFAAHGLWVDPDVDIHFCLHEEQAARVRSLGAELAVVRGPVVAPKFRACQRSRQEARQELGFEPGDPIVLIVAGSWGAGHVERSARAVATSGRFHPVVVTGSNEHLARRMAPLPCVDVLGWVDDMDRLVVAADVVVENAGGLMAMEAMAVGTPVVSYQPIAGHGRDNVARMASAQVSLFARSEPDLIQDLDRLVTDERFRGRLTASASAMFRSDVADHVAAMADRGPGCDVAEGYASA